MILRWPTAAVLLIALCLLGEGKAGGAMTRIAPAESVTFTEPARGAVLHPGDIVEVRWASVPRGVEELELLLSLDGGARFSVRVTEELDADARSFLWRVPNLATDRAAFAVRMGIDGDEITSRAGPCFRIAGDGTSERTALAWRAREIWLEGDDPSENGADAIEPPLRALSATPESLESLPPDSRIGVLPRLVEMRSASETLTFRVSLARRRGILPARIESRSPRVIPQRI